jgi:hypothetical protein
MKQKIIDRIKAELTPVDLEQRYRDTLDEIYPEVKIGCARYWPSKIVEELSPTDFRCGVVDYADSLVSDRTISDEIDGEHYDYEEVGEIIAEVEDEEEAEEEDAEKQDA